jgi:hypothetical protein
MTSFDIIELLIVKSGQQGKLLPFRQEKAKLQTPLHLAFKAGNLEVALWII